MEEVVQKRKRKGRVKARAKTYRHYSKSFKVRIVKMHEEEDIPLHIICSEPGVPGSTVNNWIRLYRQAGESGLEPTPHSARSVGTCPQDDRSEEHTVRLRSAAEIAFGRIYRAG